MSSLVYCYYRNNLKRAPTGENRPVFQPNLTIWVKRTELLILLVDDFLERAVSEQHKYQDII